MQVASLPPGRGRQRNKSPIVRPCDAMSSTLLTLPAARAYLSGNNAGKAVVTLMGCTVNAGRQLASRQRPSAQQKPDRSTLRCNVVDFADLAGGKGLLERQ